MHFRVHWVAGVDVLSDHPLVQKAYRRARKLHAGQQRKDEVTPFIVHPVRVALILQEAGSVPEVVAAALLHDTVEDTSYTPDRLRRDFGEMIHGIVLACTEDQGIPDWRSRKERLLAQVRGASDEARLLKAADVLANMRNLLDGLRVTNGAFWAKFLGQPEDYLWYYRQVYDIASDILPNPMRSDFLQGIQELESAMRVSDL